MYNDQNMVIVNLRRRELDRRKHTHLRHDFEAARRAERAQVIDHRVDRRLTHVLRSAVNRRTCCLLCGLGHKLVRWGQYLEQHFALPDAAAQEPKQPVAPPV